MAQSVKVNYILNLINTGTQMLFPLITFPYVCRVIEADGVGQVNFFQSIISYISLFTCLGIPMYAIREIARDRNDVVKMNRTATEILLLHSMLTLVGYIIVAILCLTVPQVQVNIPLFLILSLTIFFTAIGCEWFYQGIEDFKYITIRGLIIKTISVILLFIFVRSKADLLYYGFYTVLGNHDCWIDRVGITKELNENGIRVLSNSNIKVNIKGKELYIAGLEDLATGSPNISQAIDKTKRPVILLTHSPDVFPYVPQSVNITLAGHVHGGQVRLPLFGVLYVPSAYGNRYSQGLIIENGKKMYVTKGIGNSTLSVRFNCVPEINVIDFES